MAKEQTSRFGLDTFTSGSDLHPDREDFNARMELIDEKAAIVEQGDHGDRPLPGVPGRFWLSVDRGDLFFDTGDAWVQVVRIGSGGAGADIAVDSSAAEGTSNRAARADHTHRLPLASQTIAGAMSAADKAKLDQATPIGSAGRLMQRDEDGRARVADPSSVADIANKRYVDAQRDTRAPSSHTHSASDIDRGTLNSSRLPPATIATQGALSATDKLKLDDATPLALASRLVTRDSAGDFYVKTPTSGGMPTPRSYVDAKAASEAASAAWRGEVGSADLNTVTSAGRYGAGTGGNATPENNYPIAAGGTLDVIPWASPVGNVTQTYIVRGSTPRMFIRSASSGTWRPWVELASTSRATRSLDGLMPSEDKATLSDATPDASEGTIMRRDSAGRVSLLRDPVNNAHAARKSYVDTEVATRAPLSHTHNADHINAGTLDSARLPLATTSTRGALSQADKAKLDAASSSEVPGTILMRDGNGHVAVADPASASQIANKRYVDTKAEDERDTALWRGDLGTADLNSVGEGNWGLGSANNATLERNYPVANIGGTLEVRRWSATSTAVTQMYSTRGSSTQRLFVRSFSGSVWNTWRELANTSRATSSADGLMPSDDKAKLDGASALVIANTLVRRNSTGNFYSAHPVASNDVTTKQYVDAQRDTRAPSSHMHDASHINAGTLAASRIPAATQSTQGAISASDQAKLDAASSNFGQGGTLVLRDADGRANFAAPEVAANAATKGYVDEQTATRAASSHQHSADDIDTGVLAAERLPEATQDTQGALSAVDKAKLDGATFSAVNGTLVLRNSTAGNIRVGDPQNPQDATTRGWVESNTFRDFGNAGTSNLNNLIDPGFWNTDDSNSTSGRNYPVAGTGGALEVLNLGAGFRKQYFHRRGTDAVYMRRNGVGGSNTSWTEWKLAYS